MVRSKIRYGRKGRVKKGKYQGGAFTTGGVGVPVPGRAL